MARKKVEPLKWIEPTFYLYYDAAGNMLALTNEKRVDYENELIVSYETYDKFVSGREQFKDWIVVDWGNTKSKNPTIQEGITVIPREEHENYFKNNMFEWIKDKPTEETDLSVHWSEGESRWIFLISDKARQKLYDNQIRKTEIIFFITLENDFDFLVRTIKFPIADLILDKVCVPFENSLEFKIDKISISTRSNFQSYGLAIWKDVNKHE